MFGSLRHIMALIAAMLFSAFGALAMPTAQTAAHQVEFFPQRETTVVELVNVHFAARAPPKTTANIAFTGAAVVEHGNGVIMRRHEIHAVSFGFDVGFDAPNTGLPKNGVDCENISTAGPGQSVVPRDFNEQVLFDGVHASPSNGRPLLGLNNDPRFQSSDGFQKMEMTHQLPDGTNVTVHYQYNLNTGLPYDVKIVTPQRVPPVLQPGPSVTE